MIRWELASKQADADIMCKVGVQVEYIHPAPISDKGDAFNGNKYRE